MHLISILKIQLNDVKCVKYKVANVKVCGFLLMLDVVYGDDDASRERPQYQRHQSGNRGSRGHMQQPVEENVTFLILSNSEENIRKAKKSLDEVYKCYDIDSSKQKLNDRQVRLNLLFHFSIFNKAVYRLLTLGMFILRG